MVGTTKPELTPFAEDETVTVLRALARRKTGALPEELVVGHALAVSAGTDFSVRKAALEAILRRIAAAERDELVVASRPARAVLGAYATRRRGDRKSGRPYATWIFGADPIAGSCGCPDFPKSSLGLCKHLCTVLFAVHGDPRRLARALREQEVSGSQGAGLRWDPIRPYLGRGDWMERISWVAAPRATLARRWFTTAANGRLSPRDTFPDDPGRRLQLVDALLALVRDGCGGPPVPAEPALVALLGRERARLARPAADAAIARGLARGIKGLKRDLYPYQVEGAARAIAAGRLLLADDMGLGKTTQAIASAHVLFESKRVARGLVIAPASLKSQWLREWEATTSVPAEIVDGARDERYAAYRAKRRGFLIVNYEQVLRDISEIRAFAPEMIILDEAQRIKNWQTKTAGYVKALDPAYRLALTGTPMENRLEELASILDWLDDGALAPTWRLVPWHTERQANATRGGMAGARNLDTLRARMAGCFVRRVRREVLTQLPPRTDTRIPIEMTARQAEHHDELNQPIASILGRAKKRPLTPPEHLKLMSLLTTQRIISNGMAQLEFDEVWPRIDGTAPTPAAIEGLFSPKLAELRDVVERLVVDQGRKVVVFSQWRRMLRLASWAVSDILASAGMRATFFTGAETMTARTRNVVDFHDDPDVRLMFLTDAGGVGLNLQRAASACINLELPWNPAVLEQRIGRIHRLGQEDPIDVYNLITERGIEARIAQLVGGKRALFEGLFDGDSNEVKFDGSGSFLDQIERIVSPVVVPDLTPPDDAEEPEEVAGQALALVEAADESRDERPPAPESAATPAAGAGALSGSFALGLSSGTTHGALLAADAPAASGSDHCGGSAPEPMMNAGAAPEPTSATPTATAASIGDLFSGLRIERHSSGRVTIEAEPGSAEALSALLDGVAKLLRAATPGR